MPVFCMVCPVSSSFPSPGNLRHLLLVTLIRMLILANVFKTGFFKTFAMRNFQSCIKYVYNRNVLSLCLS